MPAHFVSTGEDGDRFGLSAPVLADLRDLFAKHPEIESVGIFGSRGRGDFKPNSDLDIAVHAAQMTAAEFSQLVWEIENLPIAFSIDAVHLDALSEGPLKRKAIEESVTIWP